MMNAINPKERDVGKHQKQEHENIHIIKFYLKLDNEIDRREKFDP